MGGVRKAKSKTAKAKAKARCKIARKGKSE